MSCEQIQREILDRLAAGEVSLPAELTAHQESCAECRSYCRSQVLMFRSIDQGLRAMVNAPVPPSLLPAVRARMEERATTPVFGFRTWTLGALAAAVLAVVAFTGFWHRPPQSSNPTEIARVTVPRTAEPRSDSPAVPQISKRTELRPHPAKQPSSKLPAVDLQDEPTPEVIVLAEEREALARFIAQVPENPAAAVALTRKMPEGDESVVEIALLTIKPVEVKPLDSSEE